MADHEARGRAVHDHANDDARPNRRRRPAPDWGVGEEIFDRMPRRRFGREEHPRGGTDDGRRTIVIGGDEVEPAPPAGRGPLEVEEFASREEALRSRKQDDALWGGDEPFRGEGDAAAPADDEPEARAPEPAVAAGGVPGRRTVKIGGRPGELASGFERAHRRRPPRTVGERVGSRPDRLAAWAVALGLLLILVALATSLL